MNYEVKKDRVNAELQRAPTANERRQVGVPALAGLSATGKEDRVNAELQRAPAANERRQVGVPALAGLSANREKATALQLRY